MRRKSIIYIISMVFVMAFCGVASAAVTTDSTTDALVSGYDIAGTNVEMWTNAGDGHIYAKVTVDMKSGDKTPGIASIEFDADGDTVTGGHVGMVGIFNTCASSGPPPACTGFKLKVQAGFDILITMILREQANWASQSICNGCSEGTASCMTSRFPGEWWATAMAQGDAAGDSDRGRITMPLMAVTDTVNGDVCFTFDWTEVAQRVHDELVAAPPPPGYSTFNLAAALNPANVKYQATTWIDTTIIGGQPDDYIESQAQGEPCDCINATDIVPDAGQASVTVVAVDKDPKKTDINNDGSVGVFDLIPLKNDYNKTGLTKKCN